MQKIHILSWLFKGSLLLRKHLVHSKTEIDGSILEQVKQFNYLGLLV